MGVAAVTSLRIPITSIDADGLWIEQVIDVASFHPAEGRTLPLARLSVSGELTSLGDDELLFRGRVAGAFGHACDRCLEAAEFPFETEVIWRFAVAEPEIEGPVDGTVALDAEELDDPSTDYSYHGSDVELAVPVWEEAEMALPSKFVCREDCRGLCPVCGGNLNVKTCACETAPETDINPGLAGLKDMFPDLPEQNAEE